MPKYEEILINEYKNLAAQKKDLINKIDYAAWRMFQIKGIDNRIKDLDWLFIRWICLTKKIRQLIRIERRAKLRFKELAEKFWPIEKRIVEIQGTLFKYYDNEIKECIAELGIKDVENLNDLLALKQEKFDEFIDKGQPE